MVATGEDPAMRRRSFNLDSTKTNQPVMGCREHWCERDRARSPGQKFSIFIIYDFLRLKSYKISDLPGQNLVF